MQNICVWAKPHIFATAFCGKNRIPTMYTAIYLVIELLYSFSRGKRRVNL